MGMARIHDEHIRRGEVMSSANDIAVQNMLCLSLYDWTPEDHAWDGSMRSMRYAAVVSDRLWELLRLEQQRVGACQELIFETFFFGYFPNPSHSFPLFSFASNTVTTFTTPRRGQDIVFYTPKRSADNKWT